MAIHPYSAVLAYDLSSAFGTYVTVAEVVSVNGVDITVADMKVTHLSTTDAIHDYLPGMAEGGNINVVTFFNQTDFAVWRTSVFPASGMRGVVGWKLTLPLTGAQTVNAFLTWEGHINKFVVPDLDVNSDEAIRVELGIKVRAKFAFTAGS